MLKILGFQEGNLWTQEVTQGNQEAKKKEEEKKLERRDEERKKPKEEENIAKKQRVERDEGKSEHEENNLRF